MLKTRKKRCLEIIVLILSISSLWLVGCKEISTSNDLSPIIEPHQPISNAAQTTTFPDQYSSTRETMVKVQIEARGIRDELVLIAMQSVPRHEFVIDRYLNFAYDDSPLPINHGQTISQPYIVALMTELLEVKPGDKVLEIGTGSGYQAAVLAEMGIDVYTVEIIPGLTEEASQRLKSLGYNQVKVLNADGYYGWEEYAPYDAIIVTAAPDHLPQPLINQLVEGGRLVIPIGPVGAVQTLWLFQVIEGEILAENMGSVRFVPLTGKH